MGAASSRSASSRRTPSSTATSKRASRRSEVIGSRATGRTRRVPASEVRCGGASRWSVSARAKRGASASRSSVGSHPVTEAIVSSGQKARRASAQRTFCTARSVALPRPRNEASRVSPSWCSTWPPCAATVARTMLARVRSALLRCTRVGSDASGRCTSPTSSRPTRRCSVPVIATRWREGTDCSSSGTSMPASRAATSPAWAGRASGSLSSIRATSASSSGGTSGRRARRRGAGSKSSLVSTARRSSPAKGV